MIQDIPLHFKDGRAAFAPLFPIGELRPMPCSERRDLQSCSEVGRARPAFADSGIAPNAVQRAPNDLILQGFSEVGAGTARTRVSFARPAGIPHRPDEYEIDCPIRGQLDENGETT